MVKRLRLFQGNSLNIPTAVRACLKIKCLDTVLHHRFENTYETHRMIVVNITIKRYCHTFRFDGDADYMLQLIALV